MKVTEEMRKGGSLIGFQIPEVGSFRISHNSWKYSKPFPHYNKEDIIKHNKECDEKELYVVWHNGGGIGYCNSIVDGCAIIKRYAERWLKIRANKLEEELAAVRQVLDNTKVYDWISIYRQP